MSTPLLTIVAMTALGIVYLLIPGFAAVYYHFNKKRVVTCPETKGLAEVEIDARRAACSSFFGVPRLRIKDCTRWPRRKDCAQDCLRRP